MAGVRFCSATNSTLFTTCCGVAICDSEGACPKCGEEVPLSPNERWDMAMNNFFGPKKVQEMRRAARRKRRLEVNHDTK